MWHNLLLRPDGLKLDYDGFGRLTRRQDKNGVVQHFTYDDEQRVKEIRLEGNSEFRRVEYRYDPLGRRTHKILWRYGEKDPETIRFDWQGLQLASEQSDREPDHYVQYVYTEGSYEPLARVDSVFDGCEIYWYHTELNGLPERVTDADGHTVWRGQFSTWGKTERELSVPQWQVPQNLRFQGQYLDRESGLHYNLFRYYDPVAGRYTQMDPIGLAGGLNTYSYVGDPLTWVDPWGLMPCGTTKFYRSMSHEDYEYLRATGKLRGTSETFISPRRAFSENYEGVLVRFHLKTDALEQLKGIGVKDSSFLTKLTYPDMPDVSKGWKDLNAFFKAEGDQINIGLGKGKALDIFNEGIYKFERLN